PHKKDYDTAARHLSFWVAEAESAGDDKTLLLVRNEEMGLYRKIGKRDEALASAEAALALIDRHGLGQLVGSATTFLNAATVYKAFGMAERSLSLFERARGVYEKELEENDGRLAGLYNNMALALVDVGRFEEAFSLYGKALSIVIAREDGAADGAVTYLNMASLKEAELGLVEAETTISEYLAKAKDLLESVEERDGAYAFVCEKCATVFGYYGYFRYESELKERARIIYEGT
ncbi:MAG: tetratricopeptide repeat protein, partial [Clostridia bacterium]|nr:tetratricopeptide repeat protein [Clostridia bacterium]